MTTIAMMMRRVSAWLHRAADSVDPDPAPCLEIHEV